MTPTSGVCWTRSVEVGRSQRDEDKVEAWKEETWPELKKAAREGRTLVFVDEAAFYLLPTAMRIYAPEGETPVLRYPFWDHLSVISTITPEGKLYTMKREKAFDSAGIVRFLKHLLRHISGKLLVLWDGLPAHRSQAVKDFLREGATRRLHLEQLPGYAPELNPAEGVWHYLKNVEMKNLCCHDLQELHDELRKAVERLRHKTDIIQSFTRHALAGASV